MAWLGIKTMELAPELASQLELEGGAVIEMVLPDSPAEKAGSERLRYHHGSRQNAHRHARGALGCDPLRCRPAAR